MVFVLGVIAFALGLVASVALHEAGHMWTARALGMKVRRFYIGFGPKLWSTQRGETEYGVKAIPAGGFCDIAGMTALDELAPDEVDRAMYKQKTWKRVVVMAGGISMNFVLAIALFWVLAFAYGLPNRDTSATVGSLSCVAPTQAGEDQDYVLAQCSGVGPAQAGGMQAGDRIVAIDGNRVDSWSDAVTETRKTSGITPFTVERDGRELTLNVRVEQAQRWVVEGNQAPREATVGAIGIAGPPALLHYNPLSAVPATFSYTGTMIKLTVQALGAMPGKVVDLWHAVTGGERGIDTPMSVVGASVIGGQAAERGMYSLFLELLASMNLFLALFNLLPLLPLDGGHVAVAWYERIRNWWRQSRGRPEGAPVDYTKLLPITYVFVLLGGGYMLLTLAADIVNPIKVF